ncbi:phosphocholine cytidylyltransferase family protein [Candidatus Thioglobus sp.]|jgi:choline kinase|nr:phosphocholine cytidylyltransferase family protein [Candidatus Thioglobus sp.]
MKAIILAAGKGTRLYPITLNKPKGLLEIGNETILDRLVNQFLDCGINDILIVVGYQKEAIINHFGDSVRYANYDDFSTTNNLHTLWSIRKELNEDVIITFADLVLHNAILTNLITSNNDFTMVIDTSKVLESTMRVAIKENLIKNITTTSISEANGNFIGIAKINKKGCQLLVNQMSNIINGSLQDYYTIAIDNLARSGTEVNYLDVKNFIWREVDTLDEYEEVISIYNEFS